MKNLCFLFLIITHICFSVKSQGNLQFNQVLAPSITSPAFTANGQFVSSTIIVPSGKVWKVENASFSRIDAANPDYRVFQWGGTSNITFYLDDYAVCIFLHNGVGYYSPIFPIWLREGTHTLRIYNNGTSYQSARGTLSVLEFNIVP